MPRTEQSLAELEARPDCHWMSLPLRVFFDCGSAELASAEALSRESLGDMLDVVDRDPTILAVKAYGTFSAIHEIGREDLALARARVLARQFEARFRIPTESLVLGAGPTPEQPEPCVRDGTPEERRRTGDRFVQLGVLRCSAGGSPP